jgi:futalosine hydrolase
MILMTGCAGGFERAGMTIGDIAIASEENDAQLGIEPENTDEPLLPLPFDLGSFNGEGVKHKVRMDSDIASSARNIIRAEFSGRQVNIRLGPFITVSTITATESRADQLFNQFRPCMENMEGVAGAYIAKLYKIPFLEIRCASNLVGKRDRASWDLDIACERSAKAAIAWMRR